MSLILSLKCSCKTQQLLYCMSVSLHSSVQLEMDEKAQKLETLQSKISDLKKCSQIQETPAKLQVLKVMSSRLL